MSQKYYTTTENVLDVLGEQGLAILPGFLTKKECREMTDGFWSTFEHITNGELDREDSDTWRTLTALQPTQGMLFQSYGIGQAQVLWDIRQKEKILGVFRDIYDDDDLTVSMDGLAFSLPPEYTNCGWARGPDNTHVDQSLLDNNFNWVQGWITSQDVHEGDATFSFIPKSHLKHKDFYDFKVAGGFCEDCGECDECIAFRKYKGDNDWYVLTGRDIQFFAESGGTVDHSSILERVQCPAGSMIIWDSRLFHSGSRPQKGREHPSTRMVAYVTYYPKAKLSDKQKKYHLETFTKGETSTHHLANRFLKKPRQYGPPSETITGAVPLPRPILNEIGKELLEFHIKEPLDKFVEFCNENDRYPTAKDDKELATWFAKEKKKARDGGEVDRRLSDLFEDDDWYNKTRPMLQ